MRSWMNLGQQFKVNSVKFSQSVALKDSHRTFTYFETNRRVNCLANGLINLGFSKGDKIAVIMENSIEFIEIYLATAKIGLIIVPVNFRLLPDEISYIINNSDAKIVCFSFDFYSSIKEASKKLPKVLTYISVDKKINNFIFYYDLLFNSYDTEPKVIVNPEDTWLIIYTSGTTGDPKGVVRSHESHISFYLINAIDFEFNREDICMNIMPLCHINSVFFSFIFLYIGAVVYVHPARLFDVDEVLKIIEKEKITFISLIPTHYSLILKKFKFIKNYNVSSVKKLLCSSAAVRKNMKLEIMKFYPGVKLYEAYGSSEAGIVTILKPEDQLTKLGYIGYESLGTDFIKILDEEGNELNKGEVGEIYSKGPMLFDRYYKLPELTKNSFNSDGWFSAGDMGCVDQDGFYKIVDRKDNMIITGGEHVYPSEVEEIISEHENVSEVAVIGIPDNKWGEKVIGVIVPKKYFDNMEEEIIKWCKNYLSKYKCPKDIFFVNEEDIPKTNTGKILHRILRERFKK